MNQAADMTGNYRKDPEVLSRLTSEQYRVTQKNGTEPPFRNEYWDNKEPGIYVDVVSGEPLFASVSKFDSRTGWPSFTVPLEPDNVVQRRDFKLLLPRTEVRSAHGGSHLGHLFHDGPREAGRLALLHQLRRPPLRPGRRPGTRRLRCLPRALRAGRRRSLTTLIAMPAARSSVACVWRGSCGTNACAAHRLSYRRNGMSIFVLLLYSGYALGKVAVRFRSSTVPQ